MVQAKQKDLNNQVFDGIAGFDSKGGYHGKGGHGGYQANISKRD